MHETKKSGGKTKKSRVISYFLHHICQKMLLFAAPDMKSARRELDNLLAHVDNDSRYALLARETRRERENYSAYNRLKPRISVADWLRLYKVYDQIIVSYKTVNGATIQRRRAYAVKQETEIPSVHTWFNETVFNYNAFLLDAAHSVLKHLDFVPEPDQRLPKWAIFNELYRKSPPFTTMRGVHGLPSDLCTDEPEIFDGGGTILEI